MACNTVSAAEDPNNAVQLTNNSSAAVNTTNSSSNVVISGEVKKCSDGNPFSGVTVTATKNGTTLASTTTKDDGTYNLSFYSNDSIFTVTASYPGHIPSSKNVTVTSGSDDITYGTADFKLGLAFVYVSPSGDDGNTGDLGEPVQTIGKALSLVSDNGYIFLGSGTYKGTGNVGLTINKNVTISRDSPSSHPIMDAGSNSRIFYINGANVALEYLILANGNADLGGAIYALRGNVTVINCTFENNNATKGGAVYNFADNGNSICTFTNCTFNSNSAQDGSAVYNSGSYADGTCTFNSCIFTSNSATGGGAIYNNQASDAWDNCYINYCTFENNSASNGGAIYNHEVSYVNYCNFENNSANNGGAIYDIGHVVVVTNSNFKNNNGYSTGGAIYNHWGTLTVTLSTFKGNGANTAITSGDGGAIYNKANLYVTSSDFEDNVEESGAIWSSGDSTIFNCTFKNNNATNIGGAIENYGTMAIDNSTFTGNKAKLAGCISNYGNLTIRNSTLTGNTANVEGIITNDLDENYGSNDTMNITGSLFNGNSLTSQGSVIYCGKNSGSCEIHFNSIFGNTGTYDIYSANKSINATKNWWGDNFQGTNPQSANRVNGNVNANPWVILTINASPIAIDLGGTSAINADFNHINGGGPLTGGHIPDNSITLQIPWGDLNSGGHSINENTINGAITPVIFHASGVTVNPSYNPVKVTASADGYTTNDESAFIEINTLSDLSITKIGPTTVTAGNTTNYTISVTNNGRDYASNVIIGDILPANISNVSWTAVYTGGATGPTSGTGNLNLDLGILPVGGSCIITVNGTVLSSTLAGTVLTNTATVTSTTTETNTNDNSATTSAIVNTQSNITINKTVDNVRHDVGETVTYTVTAHNNGPSDALNIHILDSMPSDFTNIVITPSTGTYSSGIWTLNLTSGETATLNLKGIVSSVMAGKNITNTAFFGVNSADAIIYVPKSDLYIRTTSSDNNPKIGQIFTLTYKLGNNGPDNATNVTITIPLPDGFVVSSISGDGNWTIAGNTIKWTIENVPKGDPYLYISGWSNKAGKLIFSSSITSDTYNINTNGFTPLTINAVQAASATSTVSSSRTIGMQETGLPINYLILAILALFAGLATSKKS